VKAFKATSKVALRTGKLSAWGPSLSLDSLSNYHIKSVVSHCMCIYLHNLCDGGRRTSAAARIILSSKKDTHGQKQNTQPVTSAASQVENGYEKNPVDISLKCS